LMILIKDLRSQHASLTLDARPYQDGRNRALCEPSDSHLVHRQFRIRGSTWKLLIVPWRCVEERPGRGMATTSFRPAPTSPREHSFARSIIGRIEHEHVNNCESLDTPVTPFPPSLHRPMLRRLRPHAPSFTTYHPSEARLTVHIGPGRRLRTSFWLTKL
jgi:hypothetical protein